MGTAENPLKVCCKIYGDDAGSGQIKTVNIPHGYLDLDTLKGLCKDADDVTRVCLNRRGKCHPDCKVGKIRSATNLPELLAVISEIRGA